MNSCPHLEKVSPLLVKKDFYTSSRLPIFSGRSFRAGEEQYCLFISFFPSFLPSSPTSHSTFHASLFSVQTLPVPSRSHMATTLWHTAAGPCLRLLLVHWLLQFKERGVTAGRRVVNRAAVGGNQRHSGILWDGFGIREGVCGPVT